jgi:hypothetical protein
MSEYEWDVRCADLELARLERGFTGADHTAFARAFLTNFTRTVAAIHIETGSLLASSRADLLESSDSRWEAEMKYGGASAGVKNPVRYAVSELFGRSPKHGGPPSHDYLRSTRHIDDDFIGPVTSFFSRGRRTPHPERGGL